MLDLIISKGLNISEVLVTDIALSYHYCVLFKTTTPANLNKGDAEVIRKCYINDNTCALFTQAFTQLPIYISVTLHDYSPLFH